MPNLWQVMQTNKRDLAARVHAVSDTEDCYVFIHTFTYVSNALSICAWFLKNQV